MKSRSETTSSSVWTGRPTTRSVAARAAGSNCCSVPSRITSDRVKGPGSNPFPAKSRAVTVAELHSSLAAYPPDLQALALALQGLDAGGIQLHPAAGKLGGNQGEVGPKQAGV